MNIHQIVIIPGFGHFGKGEQYVEGRHNGRFSEVDVIDTYVPVLCDELDSEGIRHVILGTRSAPGLSIADRVAGCEPNTLVLHCLAGWFGKPKNVSKNHTQVYYGQGPSFAIADELGDAIGQWGHCFVHGHKTANPKQVEDDPFLSIPMTKAVAIEPFCINGPDVGEYMRRMEKLGVAIARALSDHLGARGQAKIGARPSLSVV